MSAAVERAFREESGRVLATLIRHLGGDFQLAEDALQDAFAVALATWPRDGEPANPGAWITTTARRKAIDRLRRERAFRDRLPALHTLMELDRAAHIAGTCITGRTSTWAWLMLGMPDAWSRATSRSGASMT